MPSGHSPSVMANDTTADPTAPDEIRDAFTDVFRQLSPRVYAYAKRHCDPTDAHDIVADTFLVAWRRWSEVPANALPWLLVVARNTIANRRRTGLRLDQLVDAVGHLDRSAGPAPGVDHDVVERATVLAALARLSGTEREALLLVAWDGLSSRDAAVVAGCSPRAFEVRLSRARARLTRELASQQTSELPEPTAPASGRRSPTSRRAQ